MRKALIAAAVATALFAVGAFAASFGVQSEDIASGTNPTTNCAASADVDFNEMFDAGDNDWDVATITVTLVDAADCEDADVQLLVQDDSDNTVYDSTQVAGAPNIDGDVVLTFDPAEDALTVAQVWNSAILIDDLNIPVV